MVRKDLIDTYKLEEHIDALKAGYLECHINTLKIPSFIDRCKEGLEKDPAKKEILEKQISDHERMIVENEQQMQNLSEIIDRVVEFKSSL